MPEHRIRLRGGWECVYREGDPDDGAEVACRVDLPCIWPEHFPARIRLTRPFGKPPVDLRVETVSLEMNHVPGLIGARLNGRPIEIEVAAPGDFSVALNDPLLPRNGLVLEVDLTDARTSDAVWGVISLRIRPRSS